VTWQDKTPHDREALKKRRMRRRTRKTRRTVELWTQKDMAAETPGDRVKVFYDLCRRQIKGIKGGLARDAAYSDLGQVLKQHARTLPGAEQMLALVDSQERG
jgi:hypothetical protein